MKKYKIKSNQMGDFLFLGRGLLRFLALYLFTIAIIHGLVFWVAQDSYVSYTISVLIFFFPICLYSYYRVTLRKQHYLTGCQIPPKGILNTLYYNFHRKRVVAYSFHGILSFALALILPVYLSIISVAEYGAIMILLPVVVLSSIGIRSYFTRNPFGDSNHPAKNQQVVMVFSGIMFFICTVLYGVLLFVFTNGVTTLPMGEALLSSRNPFETNQLARLIATVLNNLDAIIFSVLESDAALGVAFPLYLVVAVILLSGGLTFYALSSILRSLFLDSRQILSIGVPVERLVELQGKEKLSTKYLSRKILFFLGFYLILLALGGVLGVRFLLNRPDFVRTVEEKTTMVTELIDGVLYKVGTAQEMIEFSTTVQTQTLEEMREAINNYFDIMEGNVDVYLDKYYSLESEYLRLWNMIKDGVNHAVKKMTGKAAQVAALEAINNSTSQYMDKLLEENLIPPEDLATELSQISLAGQRKWQDGLEFIKEKNKVTHKNGLYQITISTNLQEIMLEVDPHFSQTATTRWIASSVAGVTVGILAGKITKELVEKLAGKVSQQFARKVLTEAGEKVLKKSLIGTTVGSLAPGLGNVVGFIAGAGVGILTDFATLKLEERVNRAQYREEILQSIQEQRQEYLNLVEISNY